MEAIFLTIESFLYFLNMQMILSKIIGYKNKKYIYAVFIVLIYIFLGCVAIFKKSIFIFVYMTIQFVQIILARVMNKKSKIGIVAGAYFFIYSLTSVITAFFESVFLLSNIQSFVVELVIYCFIFIALISVFVFVIAPTIIIITVLNSYLKSQNEIFQRDIEAQAKHYSDLAKANYELRRFKHDFNNIKIGLEKTLSDNDYEAAVSIIENSNYDFQNTAEKMLEFDTGNGIVDALLSDKQNKANKSNTRIVFSGSVPPDSIAPTDLCVLFGNTLDNAIEACEKFEDETEKIIFVSCKCNSGFAFVSITNPVADDIVIRGNSIDSTKADKASHGYGLYSLNKIVKKLDGSLNLSCEDKIFKVEIDLSLQQTPIYA